MKKPKAVTVKRCGCYNGHVVCPPPDPKRDKLVAVVDATHRELVDSVIQVMDVSNREASPKMKAALKREALARFDWHSAQVGLASYELCSKSKKRSGPRGTRFGNS